VLLMRQLGIDLVRLAKVESEGRSHLPLTSPDFYSESRLRVSGAP
jgi:hypothetical protein